MTLTLYRREIAIYHDQRLVHRWDEWSFAPIEPAFRMVDVAWKDFDGSTRGTLVNRSETGAGTVAVDVPDRSQLALNAKPPLLLCYFDPVGVTAETVLYVARSGIKPGFRLEEDMPEKQSGLFDAFDPPPGEGKRNEDGGPKKEKSVPSSFLIPHSSVLPAEGAYGRRSKEDRVTPVVEEMRAHQAEMIAQGALKPAAAAIDTAGADLVADIDQAIGYVRDGRGIVAIRILEKVREALVKERAKCDA